MQDDLVAGLTRQVKEEVIANYLLERRLIELQIENLNKLAASCQREAWSVGRRLARLSSLMVEPTMRSRLAETLGTGTSPFWRACLNIEFTRYVRLIRVRALTRKGKFRKLVIESYASLYNGMTKYKLQYEDLKCERAAVNRNIDSFHGNFDLLSMLSFFRNLDVQEIERKKILGDNFTAVEMAELDKNLYISTVSMEKLDVPAPLGLPEPDAFRGELSRLAEEIILSHFEEVKKIMR